jgi:hypothetical protein
MKRGEINARFGSTATKIGDPRDVRLSPNSGSIADVEALRICANRRRHSRLFDHLVNGRKQP